MAWYAELKRIKWYCIRGIDMIYLYNFQLYKIKKESIEDYYFSSKVKHPIDFEMIHRVSKMYPKNRRFTF